MRCPGDDRRGARRDLLLRLVSPHQLHEVKGHSKTTGPHKTGNDRADELAVAAKKEAGGCRRSGPRPPEGPEAPKLAGEDAQR